VWEWAGQVQMTGQRLREAPHPAIHCQSASSSGLPFWLLAADPNENPNEIPANEIPGIGGGRELIWECHQRLAALQMNDWVGMAAICVAGHE